MQEHILLAQKKIELSWPKGIDYTAKNVLDARQANKLLHLDIDLTAKCNLRCKYCDRTVDRLRNHVKELTLAERKSAIFQAHLLGAKTVEFPGAGEPMMDKHFFEIIEFIHSLGMNTVLFTSGYFLNTDNVAALYKLNVSVFLKFNSSDPETQDSIVQVKGYTAKRDAALRMLVEQGFNENTPTRLALDITLLPGLFSLPDLEKIYIWCRNNNIHPYICPLIPKGMSEGADENNEYFETINYLRHHFQALDKKLYDLSYESVSPFIGCYKCRQVNIGLFVNLFGHVWDCNGLGRYLGDIRQESLSEIWNSVTAQKIREPLQEGFCFVRKKYDSA